MIWKTTLTKKFFSSSTQEISRDFQGGKGLLIKNSLRKAFLMLLPLVSGMALQAQTPINDCIRFEGCPEDQVICANEEVDGVLGAYVEWENPVVTQTCTNNGQDGNFQMLFELNENLLTADCWNFNYITRSGKDNGKLKLFNSNDADGTDNSVVISPYLILDDHSETSFEINYVSGDYTIQLFLVDPEGNEIESGKAQQVKKDQDIYTFYTNNVNDESGIYRLKYVFVYTGTKPPNNANTGDTLIAVNGILHEDGCSAGVDFTVTGPKSGFYPVGSHDLEYEATYTDPDGKVITKTCSFNITITALDIEISDTSNVSCEAESDGSFTAVATGRNGSGTPPYEYSINGTDFQTDGIFSDLPADTYNVTVKDATNCIEVSEDIIIGVSDNEAPVITAPGDYQEEGCTISDASLPFSEDSMPINQKEFEALGGTVSDNNTISSMNYQDERTEGFPIKITRTFTASDQCGLTASDTQIITIADTTAPDIPTIADTTGECEITVSIPTTEDNCSGQIEGTTDDPLTYTEQGTYQIEWSFDDGNDNITTATQTVIVDDTTAPNAITVTDATGECEVTVSIPTTEDSCSGRIEGTTDDPITYTEQGTYEIIWTFDDGNDNVTTATQTVIVDDTTAPNTISIADATGECEVTAALPTTMDDCSGEIEGSTDDPLTYTEQGTFQIQWTFDDGNDHVTTATQTVIVDDTTAPNAISIADATGECEVTVSVPTTEDNCSGRIEGTTDDPLTYTEQGTYEITWTFDDGNDNVTTATQTVIVDDTTAPDAVNIADATGECEVTVAVPTTMDDCSGEIEGSTDDPLTYTEQGTFQIQWIFDDGNENITTATQTVIVDDTTAPNAISIADAVGECEVTVSAPTTMDNCSGEIEGSTDDPLTYTEQGTYEIKWTFDDGNDNITTATQTVIVETTTPLSWTSTLPEDISVDCTNIPEAPELTAAFCGEVNVELSEETTTTDCASNYTIKRTWVTETAGDEISHTQIITVEDTTAPVLTGDLEEEIHISCEEIPMAPELEFTDNCSADVTVEFVEVTENGEEGSFVITRTWTVSDCPGNQSVYVQTVVVSNDEIETASVDLCIEDSTFELSELFLGDYNENGTWEDPMDTGALQNGSIDPTQLEIGEFVFDYVIDQGECSSTTSVQVSINDDCVVLPCGIEDIRSNISKTVTPNGDNRNDYFEVGLMADCGFTYDLKVFNRWGRMVYESNNYQNDWDGTSNKAISGSDQLPSGTYYYIVEINQSGFDPIQSYIYLGTK